ncbi:hypothetical protein TWF506_010751 [Arthrobotrys conoides]|uniref:AAA+ ATPase domain-containing protein n=1 Tax=Arthrobotrys conoides TaxID=74498 RepID=A0AAN8NI41_9PEZI
MADPEFVEALGLSTSLVASPPVVPLTISEDTTNKDTVVLGLLTALASRQDQPSLDPQQSQTPSVDQLGPPPIPIRHAYAYDEYEHVNSNVERSGLGVRSYSPYEHSLGDSSAARPKWEKVKKTRPSASSSRSPHLHWQLENQVPQIDRQKPKLNGQTQEQEAFAEQTQDQVQKTIGYTNTGPVPSSSGSSMLALAPPYNDVSNRDVVDGLQQRIRDLEGQVAKLRKPVLSEKQTLHRIFCGEEGTSIWLDRPRARDTQRRTQHYEADIPIPDERSYFKRNKHIHFVVYQDFECCGHSASNIEEIEYKSEFSAGTEDGADTGVAPNPFSITSKEFNSLISSLQSRAKIRGWDGGYRLYEHNSGPHNCILHHIGHIRATILTFNPRQQYLLNLLFDFIEENFGDEFRRATELFSQGNVSEDTICYLMSPGGVIVQEDEIHGLSAYIVKTWPSLAPGNKMFCLAWSWSFNGLFNKRDMEVVIQLEDVFEDTDIVPINQLKYYPLEYADPESKGFLERRGLQFWRCRYRRFVNYSGWDVDNNDQFVNARFMIDTMTYRKMHPQSSLAKETLVDGLGERMKDDSPLEDNQMLVLPPTIYGFHVQEKKWFNLKVDVIQDISWNKMAFESLVIDQSTKDLVVALVSNKIAAEAGTDLMSNKGNGLIILLHGAPGTGKTLTAGNVAEHAEKPLYRVTTGDVGTDPESVEKYLTSVFYLGKIWGCVVLLDEADVFLEERTLSDLTRNALVSVFLRVLEYYDGILILTSNRVGTFDSAFKSRIQLALHYDTLSHQQRIKIWQNFIKRLEDVAYDEIDIDELSLDKNIKKLAKHNLNGRQIRNNITTARQLALYKKEQMNMGHLENVIEISQRFENYLQKVKSGTDEDIARDEGLR